MEYPGPRGLVTSKVFLRKTLRTFDPAYRTGVGRGCVLDSWRFFANDTRHLLGYQTTRLRKFKGGVLGRSAFQAC